MYLTTCQHSLGFLNGTKEITITCFSELLGSSLTFAGGQKEPSTSDGVKSPHCHRQEEWSQDGNLPIADATVSNQTAGSVLLWRSATGLLAVPKTCLPKVMLTCF